MMMVAGIGFRIRYHPQGAWRMDPSSQALSLNFGEQFRSRRIQFEAMVVSLL